MSDSPDLTPMRCHALRLLEDYKKWYLLDQYQQMGAISRTVYYALTNDILTHTEAALAEMMIDITKQNNQAAMRKLSKNIPA